MLKDISIRYKIVLMILTIFTVVAGIVFTIFSISQSKKERNYLEAQASLLAKFTADYCTAPLVFGIKEETSEVLKNLAGNKDVIFIALYDNNNLLFDNYNPFGIELPGNFSNFNNSQGAFLQHIGLSEIPTVRITAPVLYEKEEYGKIVLAYSLQKASIGLKKSMRTAALTIVFILFFVLILAYFSQKIITEPILKLASVADRVKKDNNYSLRLNKRTNDEIGILYDRFNNMLEQIEANDKNRDKTEIELKDAKEKAVNADKLKTAFLANMSHEIRTPMNSIIGFASLLNEEDIDKKDRQEYVDLINSSCNTLLHLIDDILDISKIEAGQLNITLEKCHIPPLMHELFLTFKEINTQSNHGCVNLELNIPSGISNFYINSDLIRLKQVIGNLLSNAIKFTDSGKIELGYTLVEKIKGGIRNRYIKFFVKDTGIGMPPDVCDIIFDRFTKIESDNNKLYRGAGLGLTITKKLIELLDGEIWVDSTPNLGSSFYFILPVPEELQDDTPVNNKHLNKSSSLNLNYLDNKTILIVEDDPSNFELLRAIFRKTNAKLSWSQNGNEAIEYCKTTTPDIILMDIKMPEMDGYQTAMHLRNMDIKTPIVAQTAFARLEDEKKILESGFSAYLSKPIEKDKLLKTLEDLAI